ncbi:MAG: PTS mannose transporter subunit IIA [Lachnospiraceae bacterium]|nr:PTS mannose transporter subunit IIA [Lachnospiraceae bacterium]
MLRDSEKSSIRIVIASHGTFAEGLIDSAQMLLGEQENIAAYCLMPSQKLESFAQILREEIDSCGAGSILFLTDLMNGTPFNAVVSLVRYYPIIYHITGVNLAVLIGALVARNAGGDMEGICQAAIRAAENSILDVRTLLSGLDEDDE